MTVLGAASSWRMLGSEGKPGEVGPNPLVRKMDKTGSIPDRIVRVPATDANMGRVGDFFIGMYEVTSNEYKAFIDAGGLNSRGRPEVSAMNYIGRVTIPTLMLNGKYDRWIDQEIRLMMELLGTPSEHKQLNLYETDHIPPKAEYIRDTLAWLDRYFGPVR